MKRKIFIAGAFVVVGLLFGMLFDKGVSRHAEAAGGSVTGWMWSDNIGWVSLNCSNTSSCGSSNYGVTQDDQGNWSGYGWSENIGWIKFDTGCPAGASGQCNTKLSGNNLIGWARFCAGSSDGACGSGSRADGWDGWVSMSSENDHDFATAGTQQSSYSYGPTLSGSSLTGFAWGSSVVGWLEFKNVEVSPTTGSAIVLVPTATAPVSISGLNNTLSLNGNGTFYLSWNKTGAATYTACHTTSNGSAPTWTSAIVNPALKLDPLFDTLASVEYTNSPSAQTYTLTCDKQGGGSDSVVATVTTQVHTVTLSGGGMYCPADSPHPSTPTLSWFASGATSCDAAWFTGTNATNHPTTGSQAVDVGSYTVSCVFPGVGTVVSNTETTGYLASDDPFCKSASTGHTPPRVIEH